jgi:N6-adenosine-specific RNA methylase IME4
LTLEAPTIASNSTGTQGDWISGAGGYACIYADPPWAFSVYSEKGKGRSPDGIVPNPFGDRNNCAERHYKTMPLDEIAAMPVGALAAKDCVLFLWAVDPMLPAAIMVGERWGFTFKTVGFVWAKQRRVTSRRGRDMDDDWHREFPMGTGYWTRANPELCLLFTRGKPKRLSASVRKLVVAPRREHSRKPDEVRASIEQLVAGPRLELFARTSAPGWDAWGNEVGKFDGKRGVESGITPAFSQPVHEVAHG